MAEVWAEGLCRGGCSGKGELQHQQLRLAAACSDSCLVRLLIRLTSPFHPRPCSSARPKTLCNTYWLQLCPCPLLFSPSLSAQTEAAGGGSCGRQRWCQHLPAASAGSRYEKTFGHQGCRSGKGWCNVARWTADDGLFFSLWEKAHHLLLVAKEQEERNLSDFTCKSLPRKELNEQWSNVGIKWLQRAAPADDCGSLHPQNHEPQGGWCKTSDKLVIRILTNLSSTCPTSANLPLLLPLVCSSHTTKPLGSPQHCLRWVALGNGVCLSKASPPNLHWQPLEQRVCNYWKGCVIPP